LCRVLQAPRRGANPVLTVTVSGVKNGDEIGGTYETAATKSSPVGVYAIVAGATGEALGNYQVTLVDAKLVVGKAPLTVKADDKTKLFRAQNPEITGTVVGAKNGDVLTANHSTTATVDSSVGSYPILPSVSGTALSNYTVKAVPGTLRVMYGWNGFLQPINDTAHQVGVQQSKFKLGQTIPAKFVIKDAAGNVVQQATSPRFSVSGNRGTCGSGLEVDTVPMVAPEAGQMFGWTGTHYQYNWSTKGFTAGEYRLWANLAEGSTVSYVDICLTK